MKFWDTIAKMCGVKVDASRWGDRPLGRTASARPGGVAGPHERYDEIVGNVRGHVFNVEMKAHSLTATIDGRGFRVHDWSSDGQQASDALVRIGVIAIERIRPMAGKSGNVKSSADTMSDLARKAWKYESAADKPS
jgi:hypothetical protein